MEQLFFIFFLQCQIIKRIQDLSIICVNIFSYPYEEHLHCSSLYNPNPFIFLVQASLGANTFAITGHGESKRKSYSGYIMI